MFGTSGIRKKFATYDKSEENFTPNMALRLGQAIGTSVKSGTVVVGRDSRTTALAVEYAITSGLISAGCKVLTLGLVTTPTLAMSIDYLEADCGIMITASHNPPEYIGIKIWGKNGLGYSPAQESQIEEIYNARDFVQKSWNELGSVIPVQNINEIHLNSISTRIQMPPSPSGFHLLVDPGNGSASEIGPMLLRKMQLPFISLNSQPDGFFPGRQSEPTSTNLSYLTNFVSNSKDIELGIAFDGDADRVVFIDEEGKIVESIRVLTFLAREYVRERYPDPKSRHDLAVVTPVNSSGVIEHILEPMGVRVFRTKVGDINVSLAMQRYHAFLGGENCGVYIWPEFTNHMAPDSLAAVIILLKYIWKYDVKFSELLKDIPEFAYIQREYNLQSDLNITDEIYEKIAGELIPLLSHKGYHNIRKTMEDGLHLLFDEGWLLIRKSGTTPMMRINAESKTNMAASMKILEIGLEVMQKYIPIRS